MSLSRPVVVLDASRYQARWSDDILDECFTHLVADRPDVPPAHLQRTRSLMNVAIPDAIVTGYESLIETIELPDAKDRHVVAAAISAAATMIVTANLADFPPAVLADHSIEAVSPDEFVHRLLLDDLDAVAEVVDQQAADLHNPPMTVTDLLDGLAVVGLARTVAALRTALL